MALSWWIASLKADSDGLWAWVIVDNVAWVLFSVTPTTPPIFEPTSIKRASPDTLSADSDSDKPLSKYVLIILTLFVPTHLVSDVSRFRYEIHLWVVSRTGYFCFIHHFASVAFVGSY